MFVVRFCSDLYGSKRCLGRTEADRKITKRAVVVDAQRSKENNEDHSSE